MIHRIHWISASVGIACLGLMATGCSDSSPQPEAEAVAIETADAAEVETVAAVEVAAIEVRAETQARIDAFTADAVKSLKRSGDFLAGQQQYSFEADVFYDVLQPNGQMLEFGGTRDVLIRRPDRLRAEAVDRDGDVMQLFFDGQSILIDMPNEDAYMKAEKPGTLYAALDYLVEDLGAPAPLEDFASENFAADALRTIESGYYVEHVRLDDQVCEQLAFRTDEIDFQIWIRDGEEPLPCRLVITYKQAEGHPQFTAQFSHWDLSPEVDDEMFSFTPPESAERLQIQALAGELRDQMEGK